MVVPTLTRRLHVEENEKRRNALSCRSHGRLDGHLKILAGVLLLFDEKKVDGASPQLQRSRSVGVEGRVASYEVGRLDDGRCLAQGVADDLQVLTGFVRFVLEQVDQPQLHLPADLIQFLMQEGEMSGRQRKQQKSLSHRTFNIGPGVEDSKLVQQLIAPCMVATASAAISGESPSRGDRQRKESAS